MADASLSIHVGDDDRIEVTPRIADRPGCVVTIDAEHFIHMTPNAEEKLFALLLGRRAIRRGRAA